MNKKQTHLFVALSMASILLILLLLSIDKTQTLAQNANSTKLVEADLSLNINSTQDLFNLFGQNHGSLSIDDIHKALTIRLPSIPADFKTIRNIQKKKNLFILFMVPIILEEQQHIRQKRQLAKLLLDDVSTLKQADTITWFNRAVKEYKINSNLSFHEKKQALFTRLDELPLTLILAQAAIESGWGTSRFAIEGNSLFGEWTYNSQQGITPNNRAEGASHQVKAFPSLQASIRSYLKNINRNNAYKELRNAREKMRHKGENLNPKKLAKGLHRYSQKGQQYVEIVQRLLNSSEFKRLQGMNLSLPPSIHRS